VAVGTRVSVAVGMALARTDAGSKVAVGNGVGSGVLPRPHRDRTPRIVTAETMTFKPR
jgi:hypothetical protein